MTVVVRLPAIFFCLSWIVSITWCQTEFDLAVVSFNESALSEIKKVCYKDGDTDLGCFPNELGVCAPLVNAFRPAYAEFPPKPPHVVKTRFILHYESENGTLEESIISYNDPPQDLKRLLESTRSSGCFKAVVHGWRHHRYKTPYIVRLSRKLVRCTGCATIEVDWGSQGYGSATLYFLANSNTRLVGRQLGKLLEYMATALGDDSPCDLLSRTELIGHSLGGQVVGRTGAYLRSEESASGGKCKVAKIFALDPAGVYYENQITGRLASAECRVDRQDADCVRVLHTSISPPFVLGITTYGIKAAIGHYDIYPDGGSNHSSCPEAMVNPLNELNPIEKFDCWHSFAYVLYEDSLCTEDCKYLARRMSKKGQDENDDVVDETATDVKQYDMNEMCSDESIPEGSYTFETDSQAPYCKKSL